ncbi:MAG: outer membrane protein assembly factor BamA [Proteobacteria bacterium]|nr:outer membrane protein assembly factor BamA [Pseudomonadota bacterium]
MRFATSIWRLCAGRALVLGVVAGLFAPVPWSGGVVGPAWEPLGTGAAAQTAPDLRPDTGPNTGLRVTIRGNRRIEVETILSYMQLPTDRPITAEDLNIAVRRLFDTGLFRDVRLDPGPTEVVVEVDENPSISVIAFEGNDILTDEDLGQIVQLRPRLPFTRSGAEADAQAIIEIYRRTGRYGARVEPVIIERSDNRVDLVFEIDEGEVTGINSIDFVGNERYSDRKLRKVIDTSESGILDFLVSTDVYDPDRLELDKELLRQFYLGRGYADFTVLSAIAELAPDREGFFITFTIDEGEKYTFGPMAVVVTARGLDREEFAALLPDDLEGDTYDASEIEDIANDLSDLAGQKGFAFVQVRPQADKNTEERVVSITFELVEGSRIFVERIEIEGNTQTLDRVIRREITLIEGDAFDTRKIRLSRAEIRGLLYFKSVEIETEPGSADDRAVLKVKVQEQSTGSLSLGIGFSSSSGPIGNIAITERNFLGRGQVVNIQVTATGDTQIYDFTFTEPRFLDRELLVGSRFFFVQDDRTDTSSFSVNSVGFSPQIGFPVSEDLDVVLRYEFLTDDIDVNSNASPVIRRDKGSRITSSVGYLLSLDQRNDPVEPTGGYLATVDQQVAGFGGSSRFVKTRGLIKTWYGLFGDAVVASVELEGGALLSFGKDSRITERFFLGGENFRGFADEGLGPRDLTADDALGGNYYTVARFELSFPIGLPEELGIFGGAFMDAGTLFGLDDTTFGGASITDAADIRVAAGGLLFLDTPLGPLQISFGFPLIKKSFDETEFFRLSLGTRF